MIALVRDGMAAGGIGLSSGIYYAPGSYAKTDEVIAMAKAAGEAGGVYESHIRDEADYNIGVVAAVDEVIRVAEEGTSPGIVAHMKALGPASWGLSMTLVEHIQQARDRGVEVWADQYPYDASGTGIVGALIPRWAEVGGRPELLKRIDGRDRERLLADIRRNFERRGGPEKLVISFYTPNRSLEGKTLADVAKMMKRTPDEAVLDLLVKGDASLVSFNMSDEDIDRIMRQPFTMTCTDGDLVAIRQWQAASARQRRVRAQAARVRRGTESDRSAVRDPIDDEPAGVGLRHEGSRRAAAGRVGGHSRLRSVPCPRRRHVSAAAPARRRHAVRAGQRHRRKGWRRVDGQARWKDRDAGAS